MVAPFKCAFRIDQDVGNVLDVANFGNALADFEKRVVASAPGIGWIE